MFANRRSSQKPDEDLYTAFKQSFPEVGPGTTSTSINQGQAVPVTSQIGPTSIGEAIVDPPDVQRSMFDNINDATKETGTTPKPFNDQWRLTPSLLDPSSFAFSAFANQQSGYYTPTPGGYNTLWHSSAAGDLHTPGALGLNTPLSLPHSMHGLHAADPNIHFGHFNPQLLHQPQSFHHEPFHGHGHHIHLQQQPNYAPPSHFLQHEDSGYAGLDDSSKHPTPKHDDNRGSNQGLVPPPIKQHDSGISVTGVSAEKFRFSTTLNAPTAMIRTSDEIPVTYLNKGQAYTLSIQDTIPPMNAQYVKYRTYVRVSFEDEQQRAKPGACWQLWREGRGSNEAHQRGGKLLAVEYVDPNQGGDDEIRKPQIELERASFDGFVVNWHPNNRHDRTTDCSISVRFNFLSTDFSHSKGVKGIPVRLCAKTEILTAASDSSSSETEVCFAKVKLFRDHGAERKLSNDIAHVKKSIEKLKQQISQAEAGIGAVGKRKRSGSMAKGAASRSKPQKHKRSWSADSDAEAGRMSTEEDLHMKLVGLQDMFLSTRPLSVLYLRGDPEDDPDLFPVKLTGGDESQLLARAKTWESRHSASESPTSNVESPTPSSASVTPKRKFTEMQQSAIQEEEESEEKQHPDRSETPERPTKMIKREPEAIRSDILALDVDATYQPPPERPAKPVACFYVKEKDATKPYYRAVYLSQRTVRDLVAGIADKFDINPDRISRVTHVNAKGLQIIVDEDVVRELQEGQDMVVEFTPITATTTEIHDFMPLSTITDDKMKTFMGTTSSDPLEMWLNW